MWMLMENTVLIFDTIIDYDDVCEAGDTWFFRKENSPIFQDYITRLVYVNYGIALWPWSNKLLKKNCIDVARKYFYL